MKKIPRRSAERGGKIFIARKILCVVERGLFVEEIKVTILELFGAHAESVGDAGVVEVAALQASHEAARNAIVDGINVDLADVSLAGFGVADVFEAQTRPCCPEW